MFLQFCTVAVLLGSIEAFTRKEANDYMDRVLNGHFPEEATYNRLDPYKLEDIEVPINYTGAIRGKAVLSNGRLINLSKAQRSADCTVPFYQSANITFTCFLKFDDLHARYSANVSFDDERLSFFIKAHIGNTNVTVQVNSNQHDDIPNLRLLFINDIGVATTNVVNPVGSPAFIISGEAIARDLERKTIQSLHRVIGGRFKTALAYSIYKTPVFFGK